MSIVKINIGLPNEKIIGELIEDKGIFFKLVSKKHHLFRKKNAWGIDAKFFTDVLLPKNYFIEILDKDENKYYGIEASEFKKYGFYYHFKNQENHYSQIFLSRDYFKIIK